MSETVEVPAIGSVEEAEFHRLLGYPRGHRPADRARNLAAWARAWYGAHGRPWIYRREVGVEVDAATLRVEGRDVRSESLRAHLLAGGAERAVLLVVSAGAAGERQAARLWDEQKPDEYFFLETYGAAVVEHLVATAHGRECARAAASGWHAIRRFSPGYTGWDVSEQGMLFDLISAGQREPFPEPLRVHPSGMPEPRKSLLAVIGLTRRASSVAPTVPCTTCALPACAWRRASYRPAMSDPAQSSASTARYAVNVRALAKWAGERLRIVPRADGGLTATFRFDGTTCANAGQPLAFDYEVVVGPGGTNGEILSVDCRPAPGDTGHQRMCAYAADARALWRAIAEEAPRVGGSLDDALAESRPVAPAGCHCTADSRAHKWGLALETIHFAVSQLGTLPAPPFPPSPSAS